MAIPRARARRVYMFCSSATGTHSFYRLENVATRCADGVVVVIADGTGGGGKGCELIVQLSLSVVILYVCMCVGAAPKVCVWVCYLIALRDACRRIPPSKSQEFSSGAQFDTNRFKYNALSFTNDVANSHETTTQMHIMNVIGLHKRNALLTFERRNMRRQTKG